MVIYKTTNLVNGKQYIGRDGRNNPNYLGSGAIIKKAIQRYGKENFKKEIIEECSSFTQMVEREEYWLNYYDAGNNPNFYNIHNSSFGFPCGESHPFYGKHIPAETKQKMRESATGRIISEETRKKMRENNIGKKLSITHRKKISESNSGERHAFYGKTHTDESKKKMSKSARGRIVSDTTKQKMRENSTGNKNPMYGKSGENSPTFKGYVLCVSGEYTGQRNTIREWSSILGIYTTHFSSHLSGKKYKNGIKGNFFKWEDGI